MSSEVLARIFFFQIQIFKFKFKFVFFEFFFKFSNCRLVDAPPKIFPWDPVLDDDVILYADRSYKKFDQIFISYGPKSNADLLLLYGFALERNPFNAVQMTFYGPSSEEQDPLFDLKKDFYSQFFEGRSIEEPTIFPLYMDRFADEMLQYLRFLNLQPYHLYGKTKLSDIDFTTIIDTENESDVLDTIKSSCEEALLRFPPLENDDTPAAFLTKEARNCKRLIAAEKRILASTISACTRKKQDLLNY